MFGYEGLEDMLKVEMSQVRAVCYQRTGNRLSSQTKYVTTYIFHYLPEKFFIFFLALVTVTIARWSDNPLRLFQVMDVVGIFYKAFRYPSKLWLSYFCRKKGGYDSVLQKMWLNPIVPYHVIIEYIKFNGRPCPEAVQ